MKVIAKQNRDLVLINAQNTQNENEAEKILLQVPEQYEDFNKKIVFVTPDGNVWDIITNNEYLIKKAITKYNQVDFYIWLTKDDVDFRSQTKTLKFYHNVDASDEITDEEIGRVNTIVNILEEEITKVDNIDIDAEKVGNITTITLTDKDGNTKTVDVLDGQDGRDGVDGQDGYTPVKGVDYWTETEQNEIISTATTNVENNFASTIATIQSNSSNALNTANTANNTANTAKSIAEGANQALSYTNYQTMITAFNELADNVYKVGQNIMIITLNVPDLWISAIENTSITYNYTNDEAITTALSTNGYIQVGYYKLSALETQKVDLTDYYTKTGTENKIEDYLYQIMPTDSASGTIATINDATTMFNAIDVTGTIEPVQDLHGYDSPWSAGGGKNLYNVDGLNARSSNGIKVTVTDGTITFNGTATARAFFTINNTKYPNDSYAWSFNNPIVNGGVHASFRNSSGTYFGDAPANAVNKTVTVTGEPYGIILYVDKDTTLTDFVIKPQLEKGSSATSWTPYSNICPITGWTGASVVRTGVNVWDEEWEVGGFDDNGEPNYDRQRIRTKNYIFVKPNTTYCFFNRLKLLEYNANKEYVGSTGFIGGNAPATKASTFTTGSNTYYLKFVTTTSYSTTYGNDLFMNYPSTDTTYHPYSGTTYPISWQSEAGTVYGGYLDISTGTLVKEWDGIASYSGESLPAEWISDRDVYAVGATPTTGAQVVYKLATPITYQLTPQQIAFLLGTNNLWVDTGDINVTYKADIQKYIDKKTN